MLRLIDFETREHQRECNRNKKTKNERANENQHDHQDRRAANDQGRKLAEVESLNFAIAGAPLIPNSPVIPAQAGIQTYLSTTKARALPLLSP